jgi:hypothetical protein
MQSMMTTLLTSKSRLGRPKLRPPPVLLPCRRPVFGEDKHLFLLKLRKRVPLALEGRSDGLVKRAEPAQGCNRLLGRKHGETKML